MVGWTQCAAVHWPQHSSWHLPPSRGQELEMPHPWDAARFWDAKASSLKDVRRLFATTGGWHAVLFVTVHTRTGFCKNTLNNFAAALWKVAVVFFCFHRKQQWVVILSFVNFLFAFGNIRSWVAEPFLKWGGHKCTSKNCRKFLWFELAVTSQVLKYCLYTTWRSKIHYFRQNYYEKRMGKTEIQIGWYRGDPRQQRHSSSSCDLFRLNKTVRCLRHWNFHLLSLSLLCDVNYLTINGKCSW